MIACADFTISICSLLLLQVIHCIMSCALSNQNEPRYLHTPVMIRNVEPLQQKNNLQVSAMKG